MRFRCSYTAQGGGDPSSAPDFVYASTAFIQPLLLAMLASQDASAQDMAALVNDRWDQGFVYETEDARTSVTVTCYGYVVDRSTGMLISHDAPAASPPPLTSCGTEQRKKAAARVGRLLYGV